MLSQRPIMTELVKSLKKLDYRGYDASGFAGIMDAQLVRERALGDVDVLINQVNCKKITSKVGIAHTRWATHGANQVKNTHPFVSKNRIALVHNGIIRNHAMIARTLQAKGYVFESDTDSEVLVHAIDDLCQQGCTVIEACHALMNQLEGAYAVCFIHVDYPQHIFAFCYQSSLVLGKSVHGLSIASDQAALSDADVIHYMAPRSLVCLSSSQKATLWIDKVPATLQWEDNIVHAAAQTLQSEHYMFQEMQDQPQALRTLLQAYMHDGQVDLGPIAPSTLALLCRVQQVHIIACGSSFYAGSIVKHHFEKWARLPCSVEIASEYRYQDKPVLPDTLCVVISQSGETADTIQAIHVAKRQPYAVYLALCNTANSALTREVDYTLMLHAGVEVSVASTKAFMNQVVLLQLLCLFLMQEQQAVAKDLLVMCRDQLAQLPEKIEQCLGCASDIKALAKQVRAYEKIIYVGRGTAFTIALEGALKLKELAYLPITTYPLGELKHGPLALIDERTLVVALLPQNDRHALNIANLHEIDARGGHSLLIGYVPESFGLKNLLSTVKIDCSQAWQDIALVVPLQLLAYYIAIESGCNVDRPRNLAKSVTVE